MARESSEELCLSRPKKLSNGRRSTKTLLEKYYSSFAAITI